MADVIEVNVETGDVTTRDYTPEEIAARVAEQEKYDALIAKAKADGEVANAPRAAAIEAATTKLTALGLTQDEVNALFGIAPTA
jgi:hypothetical protein